jgi:HEAT repeat protein
MWVFCGLIILTALPSYAQPSTPPDYLQPLLTDLMHGDDEVFDTAFDRVRERSERQLYSPRDLHFVVVALTQRAHSSADLRPQIITLLGQIGSSESVPVLMEWVRTGSHDERLSALQALGWIGDAEAVTTIRRLNIPSDDAQTTFMRVYALKSIAVKERIRTLSRMRNPRPDAWCEIVSETLREEPNWLVRADIARMLENWQDRRVWALLFDAHDIWTGPEQYSAQIQNVLSKRYRYDSTGFLDALMSRNSADKVFGLVAISESASPDDLPGLMELAETDPDVLVREHAARVLGRLLNR